MPHTNPVTDSENSENGKFSLNFLMRRALKLFGREVSGNVAMIFGLSIVPVILFAGAAIDYSRALATKTDLQNALDAAVLAAAGGNNFSSTTANNVFNTQHQFSGATAQPPNFTPNGDGSWTGVATATIQTAFLGVVHINSLSVKATATVSGNIGPELDCIIALGDSPGADTSPQSINLNGVPVVNLQGCSIRSNQSMKCNGHNGNAASSIAAGTETACSNPITRPAIPDIYASLRTNITAKCGANVTGVNWTASDSPTIPTDSMIQVSRTGYTEYHVCGDLNVSGTGTLNGSSPATDTVIVIENGSIHLADNSTITANRMTFVFTGSDAYSHTIYFPNGHGHLGTLNVEPSISAGNPWIGVSLYQDPIVTQNVNVSISDIYGTDDMNWGPGGALNVDGVAYLPHSDVTISGIAGSANNPCTVFVVGTLTTNGSPNLNFQQQASYCQSLGVQQYVWHAYLTQ